MTGQPRTTARTRLPCRTEQQRKRLLPELAVTWDTTLHPKGSSQGLRTSGQKRTSLVISVILKRIVNVAIKHSWARNLITVAPQKKKAISKTRAQYANRNCAFELFKAHCAATIDAKNASFHKKCLKRQKTQPQLN